VAPGVSLALAATLAAGAEAAASQAAPAERGVRYVCLVRHGHYERVDSLDDRTANGLDALGREQAKLVGKRLAAVPAPWGTFVSSDYTRARETADDIGALLGRVPQRDSLIQECTPPSSRPGLDAERSPEDLAACLANLEAAWAKYFAPSPLEDTHDLLVCHGNVIRWFVNRALGNDTRHWTSMDIGHASLTVIAVRPDGTTRVVAFSDVGHLPLEKQSWAGRGAGWGPVKPLPTPR
jgi:serine/threonine-protein phosphatase PGAM5